MASHPENMNHIDEVDLSQRSQQNRVLRSQSRCKEKRNNLPSVVDEASVHDCQENYPKSIEKQRYVAVEPNSLLNSIFDRPYQKVILSWESPNEQGFSTAIPNYNEKGSQNSSKITKKCGEIFNPYDSSFEDRISVQTMDSKQFSSSFQLDDRDFEKSSEGRKENRLTLGGTKNKDYFDNYIIEDEEENEEEKRTEANCEDNSSQRSFPKIEVERDNSETHYDQSANNSSQREKSLEGLDITELKMIEKKKIGEKNQIQAAFKQTGNENDFLKQRIRELQIEIQNTLVENHKYQKMMIEFGIKLNTIKFDSSVRHMRKYSL